MNVRIDSQNLSSSQRGINLGLQGGHESGMLFDSGNPILQENQQRLRPKSSVIVNCKVKKAFDQSENLYTNNLHVQSI